MDERGRLAVLADVLTERAAQDAKWGEQNHPDGTGQDATLLGRRFSDLAVMLRSACQLAGREGRDTWALIALEEVFEAMAETDPVKLRGEIIQAAAVFAAWAEAIDRRQAAAVFGPVCVDCQRYPVALAGQVCGECAEAEDCAP